MDSYPDSDILRHSTRHASAPHWLAMLAAVALIMLGCSPTGIEGSVQAAERARAVAIASRDAAAYSHLADDDLIVVDRRGDVMTKDDRIDLVESGDALTTRRGESAVEVRRYGDVALVMGRSVWQSDERENHDFFTRIWHWRANRWRMVAAHYTDITEHATDNPPTFEVPDSPVPTRPIATTPPPADAEAQVREAIREQHRLYWLKDAARYREFAAPDLLRIAEAGIRTWDDLVTGMARFAPMTEPPSEQRDVRVRLYGNVAVATWLDQGKQIPPSSGRYTVVFVRRDTGWQMVHMQTTGIPKMT